MDLVVIAQIITGTETLIVAIVLLFQLRQQNLQLRLQHKDFAQQIKNQIGERRTSATLSLTSSMRETLVKGRYDYGALKKTEERTFFHQWVISTLEIMIMKNLYSEETGHQESQHLKEYLGSSPGVRHAYRNSTIRQQLDLDSVNIIDEIVREIDEEVGLDGILETESSYPYKK